MIREATFFETARIISKVKPRVVFLENVANLVKHDDGKTFEVILKTLEDLGYHTVYKVMNANEYGNIPQQRNRIYIVSFRYKKDINKFVFQEMIPLTRTVFDLFEKQVYKQIGNSVCVPVVSRIAENIVKALN